MKPPMPYYGGKQRIAADIVATFPPHDHYVEPFAGGLSVLLAKPPAKHETVNDLDERLVTFWRVLRDRPDELITQCTFTPHSRVERHLAHTAEPADDMEIARSVWVELTQGRAGTRRKTGWRFYLDATGTGTGMTGYLAGYVRRMPAAAARLAEVSLECRDALAVIDDYGKSPRTLLYVDPPYLATTRQGLHYRHELGDENGHRALAEALSAVRAQVVLSGYDSDLYRSLYGDWERVEIRASTQQANRVGKNARTEVLWLNFADQHLFSEPSDG